MSKVQSATDYQSFINTQMQQYGQAAPSNSGFDNNASQSGSNNFNSSPSSSSSPPDTAFGGSNGINIDDIVQKAMDEAGLSNLDTLPGGYMFKGVDIKGLLKKELNAAIQKQQSGEAGGLEPAGAELGGISEEQFNKMTPEEKDQYQADKINAETALMNAKHQAKMLQETINTGSGGSAF